MSGISFRPALAALLLFPAAPAAAQTEVVASATPLADRLAAEMRTLAQDPRNLAALIAAGELSARLDDPGAALGFFSRAESVAPGDPRVLAGRARALVRMQRPGEALLLFGQAEQKGIDPRDFADDRGLAYDLMGAPALAQRDYRLAMARDPGDEIVRRYALSFGISGQRGEAAKLLDPLLRRNDRAAWRAQAFILAMTGDVPGAQGIAQSMMPNNLGAAMAPFLARLPTMSAADRAFAVHFGELSQTPARIADARLAPPLPTIEPAPVAVAAVSRPAQAATPDRRTRRERERDERAAARAARQRRPASSPQPSSPPSRPAPVQVAQARTTPPPVARAAPAPTPQPRPAVAASTPLAAAVPASPPVSAAAIATIPLAAAPTTVAAVPVLSSGPAAAPAETPPVPSPQPVAAAASPPPAEAPPIYLAASQPPSSPSPLGFTLAEPAASPSPAPGFSTPSVAAAPEPPRAAAVPAPNDLALAAIIDRLTIPASELGVGPPPSRAPEPVAVSRAPEPAKVEAKPEPAKPQAKPPAKPAPKKTPPKPDPAKLEPARYWAQVAGGADKRALPKSWSQLVAKAPEAFKGKQAWTTPLRLTNRLLAGPFKTAAATQDFVNAVAKKGISAFAWQSEPGQKIEKLAVK